jgi:hypothetical protein
LPFCPTCLSEFRPGFDRCEECDVDLVDELPDPPTYEQPPNPAFQSVYETTDMTDALSINTLLEANGIESSVDNSLSGLYAIGLPTPAARIVVTVPSQDAQQAAALIKKTLEMRPKKPASNRHLWIIATWVLVAPIVLLLLMSLLDLLRRSGR